MNQQDNLRRLLSASRHTQAYFFAPVLVELEYGLSEMRWETMYVTNATFHPEHGWWSVSGRLFDPSASDSQGKWECYCNVNMHSLRFCDEQDEMQMNRCTACGKRTTEEGLCGGNIGTPFCATKEPF